MTLTLDGYIAEAGADIGWSGQRAPQVRQFQPLRQGDGCGEGVAGGAGDAESSGHQRSPKRGSAQSA
ncbi:hypothetical protein [Amycolatopsis rubida]|uniref:Uncharacterized protein n=1 Tax=Amycolatopsis rubida TaxID=112413 RepID=A0A1I6AI70_9PSEU|nr:hypothetical protein [Amycolatopsis rubida]SFQ68389.1 hypothetical protein SAMN05421854_11939 [Amycolatopsis rubida]